MTAKKPYIVPAALAAASLTLFVPTAVRADGWNVWVSLAWPFGAGE